MTRSGGGLGESVTPTATAVVDVELRASPGTARRRGRRGRRRASARRTSPAPCSRSSADVRRGGGVDGSPRRPSRASRAPGPGRAAAGRGTAARACPGVAVRGVGRRRTARRPTSTTTRDQSTAEPGPSRPSSLVHGRRRWCRRSAPICGSSPRAWASASRAISSPAADVARAAASTWTSIRGAGVAGPRSRQPLLRERAWPRRRRRRPRRAGAAPRPAARARSRRLQRDRPVGLAGRGERAPACRRARLIRIGAAARSRSTTSVMPGPFGAVPRRPSPCSRSAEPGDEQVGARADPLGGDRRRRDLAAGTGRARRRAAPATGVSRVQARSVLPGAYDEHWRVHRLRLAPRDGRGVGDPALRQGAERVGGRVVAARWWATRRRRGSRAAAAAARRTRRAWPARP